MNYCPQCGGKVDFRDGAQGSPSRFRCVSCGSVFFQSPQLATACIACWKDQILLCRRGVEPGYGLWELPAGFVEPGEASSGAAVREVLEEANVAVELERVYALLNLPHINQMRVIYLARLLTDALSAGREMLDVRLFDEAEIPWGELAFATTRDPLKKFFHDRRNGDIGFFYADIVPVRG